MLVKAVTPQGEVKLNTVPTPTSSDNRGVLTADNLGGFNWSSPRQLNSCPLVASSPGFFQKLFEIIPDPDVSNTNQAVVRIKYKLANNGGGELVFNITGVGTNNLSTINLLDTRLTGGIENWFCIIKEGTQYFLELAQLGNASINQVEVIEASRCTLIPYTATDVIKQVADANYYVIPPYWPHLDTIPGRPFTGFAVFNNFTSASKLLSIKDGLVEIYVANEGSILSGNIISFYPYALSLQTSQASTLTQNLINTAVVPNLVLSNGVSVITVPLTISRYNTSLIMISTGVNVTGSGTFNGIIRIKFDIWTALRNTNNLN